MLTVPVALGSGVNAAPLPAAPVAPDTALDTGPADEPGTADEPEPTALDGGADDDDAAGTVEDPDELELGDEDELDEPHADRTSEIDSTPTRPADLRRQLPDFIVIDIAPSRTTREPKIPATAG